MDPEISGPRGRIGHKMQEKIEELEEQIEDCENIVLNKGKEVKEKKETENKGNGENKELHKGNPVATFLSNFSSEVLCAIDAPDSSSEPDSSDDGDDAEDGDDGEVGYSN